MERNHYLAGTETPEWTRWRAARADAEKNISATHTSSEVYFSVLVPLVQSVGDTHTLILPPSLTPTQESAHTLVTQSRVVARPWQGDINAGLGFRMAPRPGRGLAVYGVVKGSRADKHNIEPNSDIESFTISSRGADAPVVDAELRTPDGETREVHYQLETKPADRLFERRNLGLADYIRFDQFDDDLISQVKAAIISNVPKPLVLDLRLNAGGALEELKACVGLFLAPGTPIGSLRTARQENRVEATGSGAITGAPMVVLIGPGTQSAAEVAADAFKVHGRARLIGLPTAGQVLASGDFQLADGGTLRVAFQNFFSSSGHRLEQRGVLPDLDVTTTLDDIREDRDPPLVAALHELARMTQ